MTTTSRLGALTLAGLLSLVSNSDATELFAVQFSGPTPLFLVDQNNGSLTTIGPVGVDDIGDLTSDTRPGSGTVWGVDLTGNALVEIDPATGAATNVIPLSGDVITGEGSMTSLAFDPVSGTLYGNTSEGFGAPFDALYEIDPTTGNTTFVGRIGYSNVYALGFDQGGNLFGIADLTNELIGISTLTGNGSFIANMQVELAYDIASRPEDNEMFLVDSGTNFVYTMDTSNGNLTGVGSYLPESGNLVGLAFSAVPAPEPGVLVLLLTGLPVGHVLRRRAARRRPH